MSKARGRQEGRAGSGALSQRVRRELGGGVSQFAAILAKTRGRQDVVDLGQGFPDFLGSACGSASESVDSHTLRCSICLPELGCSLIELGFVPHL